MRKLHPFTRPLWASLLSFILLSLFGCQSWSGRGSENEIKVDAALASSIPMSAPQAIPEKPQKGFEQEVPKAQSA